eukprot:UN31419
MSAPVQTRLRSVSTNINVNTKNNMDSNTKRKRGPSLDFHLNSLQLAELQNPAPPDKKLPESPNRHSFISRTRSETFPFAAAVKPEPKKPLPELKIKKIPVEILERPTSLTPPTQRNTPTGFSSKRRKTAPLSVLAMELNNIEPPPVKRLPKIEKKQKQTSEYSVKNETTKKLSEISVMNEKKRTKGMI